MIEITTCDPENLKGIDCEKDQGKINAFMQDLSFEIYTMSMNADQNSNLPQVIKNNGGVE